MWFQVLLVLSVIGNFFLVSFNYYSGTFRLTFSLIYKPMMGIASVVSRIILHLQMKGLIYVTCVVDLKNRFHDTITKSKKKKKNCLIHDYDIERQTLIACDHI